MISHDRITTAAAFIVIFIIAMFILLTINKCEAWTGHEFRAELYGDNDWKITSLPVGVKESEGYKRADKMGYLSYVFAVRELGKWDADLMYMGPIAAGSEKGRKWAKMKIGTMMKAIDKVLPNEEIVVILFLPDLVEMSVVFATKRWKDENFHIDVAEKLNIERDKWKKATITE
jgi:hypothetical protein